MTISGPAVPVFCMYLVAAERQGVDIGILNGTLQTDIFKEYIAQKEWLFEPGPHLRLIGDLMEFCTQKIPNYKPLSVSGYHIREAGSTAAQELAFTLADGFGYVELGLSRGLDIETFAPGLSFFFDAHIDLFEEVAKIRAARRMWATPVRERFDARDPRSDGDRDAGIELPFGRLPDDADPPVTGGQQHLGDLPPGLVLGRQHRRMTGRADPVQDHHRQAVDEGRHVDLFGSHRREDQAARALVGDHPDGPFPPPPVRPGLGDQHRVVVPLGDVERAPDHRRGIAGDRDLVGDVTDGAIPALAERPGSGIRPIVQLSRDGPDPADDIRRELGSGPIVEHQAVRGLGHAGSRRPVRQGQSPGHAHASPLAAW